MSPGALVTTKACSIGTYRFKRNRSCLVESSVPVETVRPVFCRERPFPVGWIN